MITVEPTFDWGTGNGLLGISNPHDVDAAFERGEPHVGIALIGLVLNECDFEEISPRIVRALDSPSVPLILQGLVATGHAARIYRKLSGEIYRRVRLLEKEGVADAAMSDIMEYIPFSDLPVWIKHKKLIQNTQWLLYLRWLPRPLRKDLVRQLHEKDALISRLRKENTELRHRIDGP